METSGSPPGIDAFSREAIKKAKLGKVFANLLTLYGVPVGLVGLLGFALLDPTLVAPLITLAVAGAGLSVGLGTMLVNLCRGKSLEMQYIEALREKMQAERRAVRERIQGDLGELGGRIKGMEKVARRGTEHMDLAKKKNDALQKLLEEKLVAGELTSMRFMGHAEQLYLSVLDNVRRIIGLLRSIESMEKGKLRDDQESLIQTYLKENEEALELLDRTNISVATMETGQGKEATLDLETAMGEMRRLIERVKSTNVKG